MKSQRNNLSPRDYEREAEITRHRLAGNIDELSDRLTPGQVFDEVLTYARGGGGNFFRALGNAARDNPIPSLLISAGCMMFLSEKMGLNRVIARRAGDAWRGNGGSDGNWDDSRSTAGAMGLAMADSTARMSNAAARASDSAASGMRSAADTAASSIRSMTDSAKDGIRSTADSVRSGVGRATDFAGEQASAAAQRVREGAAAAGDAMSASAQRAREAAEDLRDQAAEAAEQMRRKARGMADAVGDYSSALGEQVMDSAQRTQRQAAQTARQVKDTTLSFINEQPLLAAAIGLAAGAAIAAMLPSTEAEDEVMGETSDKVKQAVGQVAAEQFENAKAAAGNIVREAQSAAEREGLTPSSAVDLARNVAEKVKRVASETADSATSEARDFAKEAKSEVRDFAKTGGKL
jgi:ElaB/YqjD/DUF883 family membrane-anchored ribosome-binding protein